MIPDRIAIDCTTLTTHERHRGIGRFIHSVINGLLQTNLVEKIILLYPQGFILKDFQTVPSIQFQNSSKGLREAILKCETSIYWATSPLMFNIPLPEIPDAIQRIAMVYDLIPLLFPSDQNDLPPHIRNDYFRRLEWVRNADQILALSNGTRTGLIDFLKINPERITVTEAFVPDDLIHAEHTQIAFSNRYLLFVGGDHPRKNLGGAVDIYARLTEAVRKEVQLVVIGTAPDSPTAEAARRRLEKEPPGLAPEFYSSINDSELANFYKKADALIFTSHFEGFGLPVLEAMSFSCPVLAAANSSLPEVVDTGGILFDPKDPSDAAKQLEKLLTVQEEREQWVKKAKERSNLFSKENTVQRIKEVLTRSLPKPSRTLSILTPLPPEKSGVADYISELTPDLNRTALCFFNPDEKKSSPCLYELGNGMVHLPMILEAEKTPGILHLHEVSLHSIFYHYSKQQNKSEDYLNRLQEFNGEEGRQHGKEAFAGRFAPDILRYPMIERLLNNSLGVIVHCEWARKYLRALHPEIPILVVPHSGQLSVGPYPEPDQFQKLGLNKEDFHILVAGFLNPQKRIQEILNAFQQFGQRYPDARLILSGEAVTALPRGLSEDLKDTAGVKMLGYVSEEDLQCLFQTADVVVALRHPQQGEASGIVMRALSVGRPVLVSDEGWFAELPDKFAWKVSVGDYELQELTAYWQQLYFNEKLRAQMGLDARRWVWKHAHPNEVIQKIVDFCSECGRE